MKTIEFFIAYRFLKEGKSQSLFIFGGAAVGVAVIVFLTSLIMGLQGSIIEQTLGNQPDIFVEAPSQEETPRVVDAGPGEIIFSRTEPRPQRVQDIDRWEQLIEDIATDPDIIAISPMATGSSVAPRGPVTNPIQLMGVEPDLYQQIVDIEGRLLRGEFEVANNGAVIGYQLAQELAVDVGDRFRVLDTQGESRSLIVRGVFDLGFGQPNQTWVFVGLRDAQTLLDMGANINRIDANVAEIFEADRVSARLQGRTRMDVSSWQEVNEDLLLALRTQSASTFLIALFVAISVALGIASVLIVTVVQKRGQVGVLRAMGASMRTVLRVFLIQGAAVGLIGSVFGTILGTGLAMGFDRLFRDAQGQSIFPTEPSPEIFIGACLLATLTGLLAAVAPARRAARLDPADAIKNA